MDYLEALIEAVTRFNDRYERCHMELSCEIPIAGLKMKQLQYLEIIARKSCVTFGEFAQELKVTKPTVTSIVNQLIKLECVRKSQCSNDGRKYFIELSEKGQQIAMFNALKQKRLAEKILIALTEDEISLFVRLINKVVNI